MNHGDLLLYKQQEWEYIVGIQWGNFMKIVDDIGLLTSFWTMIDTFHHHCSRWDDGFDSIDRG